jgi:hypothetical protein
MRFFGRKPLFYQLLFESNGDVKGTGNAASRDVYFYDAGGSAAPATEARCPSMGAVGDNYRGLDRSATQNGGCGAGGAGDLQVRDLASHSEWNRPKVALRSNAEGEGLGGTEGNTAVAGRTPGAAEDESKIHAGAGDLNRSHRK